MIRIEGTRFRDYWEVKVARVRGSLADRYSVSTGVCLPGNPRGMARVGLPRREPLSQGEGP
jgi:hypothetical protein